MYIYIYIYIYYIILKNIYDDKPINTVLFRKINTMRKIIRGTY